jgi:hypothetical protein
MSEFKQTFLRGAGYTTGVMAVLVGFSLLAYALELIPRRGVTIYTGRR